MAKELHIKIDDVIGWDTWAFWPGFMAFMLDGYLEAAPETQHLVIHLDSPGGDVIEGYRIYNRLEQFKSDGGTVEVIVEGMAASMATAIAQAASPGMRKARAASTWLMHKPLFEIMGGNASDLRKLADQLDGFEDTLVAIYAKGSGNSPETVRQHLDDAFITPQEAINRGYLDAIEDADPAIEPKKREAKAVAFYNPKSEVLNSNPMANTTAKADDVSILAQIKSLLGFKAEAETTTETTVTAETTTEETEAPAALSVETTDGTKLEIDGELAVGSAVYTKTEEGERGEALADGTYELTTGEEITVADGVITAVTPASEVAAQAKAAAAEAKAQAAQFQARIAALEAENLKLKKAPPAASGNLERGKPQAAPSASAKAALSPLDAAAEQLKNKRK